MARRRIRLKRRGDANDPSPGPTVSFLQMSVDLAALRDPDQLDAELLAKINERARQEAVAEVSKGRPRW